MASMQGSVPLWDEGKSPAAPKAHHKKGAARLRSVFKMLCLFLRPRPWQFEI